MFEWIDVYGQWFCVSVLYRYERFCIPGVAWLLVMSYLKGTAGRPFSWWANQRLGSMVSSARAHTWRVVFLSLAFLLLTYLLLYRMHWYSRIAWPITMLSFGLVLSRPRWYRIIKGLLHPGASLSGLLHRARHVGRSGLQGSSQAWAKMRLYRQDPSRSMKEPLRGARTLQLRKKRTWLVAGVIVGGAWLLWQVLGLLLDPLALLAMMAIGLAVWGLLRIANCEREFDKYLMSDPRMRLYLDAVRRISAKGKLPLGAALCSDRLKDPDLPPPGVNLWTVLFRISVVWPIRPILRVLACRGWMPTIDSAFVIQRVEHQREVVWRHYASARYGRVDGEPTKDPLDAYLKNVERFKGPWHPPEFDNGSLRKLRLFWLALTEALAECYVFAGCPKGGEMQTSLHLLKAAELLGQAGEVQTQVVCDWTRRTIRLSKHGANESLEAATEGQKTESGPALHFLNLAARCIESRLAPGGQGAPKDLDLGGRYDRFCAAILDGGSFKGDLLEHRLRSILLMRYRLIALLERQLSSNVRDACEAVAQSSDRPTPEPTSPPQEPRLSFETAMAELAYFSALISLYLARRQADKARFPWLPDDGSQGHPLAALGARIHTVKVLAEACGEPEYRVQNADHHIRRLAGMALEEEMQRLHVGEPMWDDLLKAAATMYHSCGCSRIRMMWAMARSQH